MFSTRLCRAEALRTFRIDILRQVVRTCLRGGRRIISPKRSPLHDQPTGEKIVLVWSIASLDYTDAATPGEISREFEKSLAGTVK
jgi:hypothetical protein